MASFSITGATNVAQSLTGTETGFIDTTGSIVTPGTGASLQAGTLSLGILGRQVTTTGVGAAINVLAGASASTIFLGAGSTALSLSSGAIS